MKSITKRIISTLAICGALVLEAGATAIGSLGKALNDIARVDAADTKTLTFDLGNNPGDWPTANSTTLTNYTYTLDKVDYSFGLKNIKCNSGYLMATATAVLGLPAIKDYKLTKVVAKNTGGCSTGVYVGISSSASDATYISGGAAQKWATQSSSYTYTLSGTANNTVYFMYVTSKNAQITELALTYEGGSDPTPTSTYSVNYLENTTDTVTGMPGSDTGLSNGEHTLSTTKPTRSGYDFVGWNTDSNATTGITKVTIANANVNVYAIWKETESSSAIVFTPGVDTSTTKSLTKSGVTLTATTFNNSNYYQTYANESFTASVASGNIAKIEFTCKASGTAKYGPGNYSTSTGSYSYDGTAGTWTGSANSITFSASAQVRMSLVKVYLEETKIITNIAVETAPKKVTYHEGETFDPTGLVITATYDDASTADIAYADHAGDFSFSPSGSLATTDNKVTITYKEKTVDQAITVNSDTLNSITLGGSVTGSVSSGWDLSGVVVTGNYASGSRTITDATPTTLTPNPTSVGNYIVSVEVSYGGKEASKDFSVTVKHSGETQDDALTVSEALDYIDGFKGSSTTNSGKDLFVKGTVSSDIEIKGGTGASAGTATFMMSDGSKIIKVYSVWKETVNTKFADGDINIGDSAMVHGYLIDYVSSNTHTPEVGYASGSSAYAVISSNSHTVTTTLSGVTFSVESGSKFNFDQAFNAILTANTGYNLPSSISMSLGGNIFSDFTYDSSTGAVSIAAGKIKTTDGDLTISANGEIKTFSITATLDNGMTLSNTATSVTYGSSYSATIGNIPDYYNDPTVTVTMGGNNQPTAYDATNKTITLSSVTGAIVINATTSPIALIKMTMDESLDAGVDSVIEFNATIEPETANPGVTYEVVTESTTITEYTFSGNTLTIGSTLAKDGVVVVKATSVGKDSNGQSLTALCTVNVANEKVAYVKEITVGGKISQEEQYVGKDFNPDGVAFTPVWSEGTHEEVTITGSDIDWPELELGMTSIVGQYNAGTSLINVTVDGFEVVNDYVKSIEITGDMTNKTYYSNATGWNFAGLSVTGTNASGDPATITQASVEYTANLTPAEYLSTSATKLVVTATYGQKTDTIEITGIVVNEFKLDSIEITSGPKKTNYIIGEEFESEGLVVKANYSDGSSDLNFKSYFIDSKNVDMYKAGTYTINLTADGVEDVSFNVTYSVVTPQEGYDYWELVTDAASLKVGDEILMTATKDTNSFTCGSAYDGDGKFLKYLSCISATFDEDNHLVPGAGYVSLILGGDSTGWTLTSSEGQIGMSAAKALAIDSDSAHNYFTISISEGLATIADKNETNNYGKFLYNVNSPRFLNYTSSPSASMLLPQIYKHVEQKAVVAELIQISAALKDPTKKYYEGDNLDISELTISGLYNDGKEKTITSGVTFSDNSTSKVLVAGENSLTIKLGEITGTFKVNAAEIKKYDLSVDITDSEAQYSVSPTITNNKLIENEDYTVTISPKEGNIITSVTGTDGLDISENNGVYTVTINDVSSNIDIAVESRPLEIYAVNLPADLSNVNVTGLEGGFAITEGDPISFTIKANDGYIIEDFSVTGASKEFKNGVYTISSDSVSSDIDVSFTTRELENYSVTDNTDENVTLVNTTTQIVEGSPYESDVTFATGYELDSVLVTMNGEEVTNAYNDGHIKVENVTGNLEITITSKKQLIEIDWENVTNAHIEGTQPTTVEYGGTLEVIVKPDAGYGLDNNAVYIAQDGKPVGSYNSETGLLKVENVTSTIHIKVEAYQLAEVDKTLGDGLSIEFETSEIRVGASYTLDLSLADEKKITSVSISMGESVITDTAWNESTCEVYIDSVTADITIVIETANIVYDVTYDLTNISITGTKPEEIIRNNSYTLEIHPKDDTFEIESVVVMMGDQEQTTAYTSSTGVIYIEKVTGNISITASAKKIVYDVELSDSSTWTKDIDVASIEKGEDLELAITPEDHCTLPDSIVVIVNNVQLDSENYTYDIVDNVATLVIGKDFINGNVEITVLATHDKISIEGVGILCDIVFDDGIKSGDKVEYDTKITGTIKPNPNYVCPTEIEITSYGEVLVVDVDYTYDFEEGTFEIANAYGDIVVKAKGSLGHAKFKFVNEDGKATIDKQDGDIDVFEPVSCKVSVESGYVIDSVTVTMGENEIFNVFDPKDNSIYIQSVNGDVVVTVVTRAVNKYDVTINEGYDSFVTVEGLVSTITEGENAKIVITAKDGYNVVVKVNGVEIPNIGGVYTVSIVKASEDVAIEVSATAKPYDVSYDLEHVTVGSEITSVTYGGTYQNTIKADNGYVLGSVKVFMGGVEVTGAYESGTISINNVTGAIIIKAKAVPTQVNVTYVLNGVATVSNMPSKVDYDGNFATVVTALPGYENLVITVNGVTSDAEIVVSPVTGNIEIVVTASKVTCSVSFEGEHASLDNVQSVTFDNAYVGIVTFDKGYRAKEVKVLMSSAPGSTEWVEVSGAYSNGRISINHVTGDIKIVVTIESETFTVTTNLSNATSTGVDGEYGYNDTFTATFASVDAAKFDVPVITVKVNGIAHPEFVNGNIVTITGVSGVVVIDATSKPIIKIEIENASIPGLPETINYGDEVQANVEPEVGYEIAEVKVYENGTYKPEYARFVPDEVTRSSNRGPGHWEIYIPEVTGKIEIVVDSTPLVYGVDVTGLQNVSLAGEENATHDAKYVAKLNPDAGYEDVENIKVFMNGVDVTEDVVVDDYIFISKVTGAIRISASASEINYTISYDLSHVTSSNKAEDVVAGASYMTTLTVDKDYCNLTVTVLVNGVDVTKDVYDNGTIVFIAVLGDVDIKASAVALELTEVIVTPGTLEVAYDGSISKADFVATAHYNDGTSEDVEIAEISGFNGKIVGAQDVTIVAAGKEVTVKVTVKASEVVESITATTEKTEVNLGGSFTKDDVKVTYVYTDGHTLANQAAESISGFNASQAGAQVITVTAAGKTTTITITVKGTVVSSIAASGYTDTIDQGKDYVFDGKVTATYADGSTAEVTGYRVSSVDTSEAGDKVVKITFENVSVDITIHVVQSKTPLSPTASAGIIGGTVVGISAIAVGLYFLLKKFKI